MHLKEEPNKDQLEAVTFTGKHLMVLADTEKSNTLLEKNQ